MILVQHHGILIRDDRQPSVKRQVLGFEAQGSAVQIARVAGLPEALVSNDDNDKRPVGPSLSSRHHARLLNRACDRMQPNGRPFMPHYIAVGQSPGPPEDLRPWLFELPALLGLKECGLYRACGIQRSTIDFAELVVSERVQLIGKRNKRLAFAVVAPAISSFETPRISARHAAVSRTWAGSFRLPRNGVGAR